jgi:hypothetical protein
MSFRPNLGKSLRAFHWSLLAGPALERCDATLRLELRCAVHHKMFDASERAAGNDTSAWSAAHRPKSKRQVISQIRRSRRHPGAGCAAPSADPVRIPVRRSSALERHVASWRTWQFTFSNRHEQYLPDALNREVREVTGRKCQIGRDCCRSWLCMSEQQLIPNIELGRFSSI